MSDPQQPPYAPQPENGQSANGQSPYGQQPGGYPATAGISTPGYGAAPARISNLGRTAFIIVVITVALGLVYSLTFPLMMPGMRGGYAIYQLISVGRSILGLILGVLALILGIVAVRRGAQPVLAGIAIGIAAVELLGLVTSFATTLMLTTLY